MKRTVIALITIFTISCGGNPEKDRIENLINNQLESPLPFESVKIGKLNDGTAAIIDGSWCYWRDNAGKVYCVNGTAMSTIKNCENAPIKEMFSDIEKIVK